MSCSNIHTWVKFDVNSLFASFLPVPAKSVRRGALFSILASAIMLCAVPAMAATTTVTTAVEFATALATAADGDTILLQDGVYRGQFVATTGVTIDAVNGAAADVTLEMPDYGAQVNSPQNSLKPQARRVVLDLRSAAPGSATITVKNIKIDGRYQGPTQAGDPGNTIDMAGIAVYDTNAVIDNVNIQHVAAALDGSGNYEGHTRNNGILAEGSAALGGAVTVTIKNCTIGTFQKAGIVAWGGKLNAVITNNRISGVGTLGRSGQNGMQIGSFNNNRPGTTATITGNILDNLGAPADLVATGYTATGIYPVTAGAVNISSNTVTLAAGAQANSLVGSAISYGVYSVLSGVATVQNNAFKGMSVGVLVDWASTTSVHTVTNNTLSTSGGVPVVYAFYPNDGDTGGTTVSNFGLGNAIRVAGENFSAGTVTAGNGVGVAANSAQLSVAGGTTTLFLDTTVATSNGASAPLQVHLNGVYGPTDFYRSGEYLYYTTAPSSGPLTFTNIGRNEATISGTVDGAGMSTTVMFDYGQDTSYGWFITANQSPLIASGATTVNATPRDLTCGRTYHARMTVVNMLGTTHTTDQWFNTLDCPAPTPTPTPTATPVPNASPTAPTGNGSGPANSWLVSPPNGASIPSGAVFVWTDLIDPNGDFVSYQLWVCKDGDFSNCTPINIFPNASSRTRAQVAGGVGLLSASALLFGFGMVRSDARRKALSLVLAAFLFSFGGVMACGSSSSGTSNAEDGATSEPTLLTCDEASVGQVCDNSLTLESGASYLWKVVGSDGKGGTAESDTWTFTVE